MTSLVKAERHHSNTLMLYQDQTDPSGKCIPLGSDAFFHGFILWRPL